MALFRIRQAAELLGVSDDTVRRWADSGPAADHPDAAGRLAVDGADLARFAEDVARTAGTRRTGSSGSRLATGFSGW